MAFRNLIYQIYILNCNIYENLHLNSQNLWNDVFFFSLSFFKNN